MCQVYWMGSFTQRNYEWVLSVLYAMRKQKLLSEKEPVLTHRLSYPRPLSCLDLGHMLCGICANMPLGSANMR